MRTWTGGTTCHWTHRHRGTDPDSNAYIAVAGQEEHHLTDSQDALRALILDIKAGKADHLL
ncbi:hypothetical protein [Streptomyces sp. NPDC055506]